MQCIKYLSPFKEKESQDKFPRIIFSKDMSFATKSSFNQTAIPLEMGEKELKKTLAPQDLWKTTSRLPKS